MPLSVNVVASGGLPVTIATNGLGLPMLIAPTGYGIPITVIPSGGLPIVDAGTGIGLTINSTGLSFIVGAANGSAIGNLTVSGGTGTYTFTLVDDAGARVKVAGTNGVNLQVGATSSPSPTTFPITVRANNGAGSNFTQVFTITVTGTYVPVYELLGF